MKAKILWIEGKRAFGPYFIPDLRKKDFTVEIVSTGKAADQYLSEDKFNLVVLNAATFRTSGKRICNDIRTKWEKLPILMIANPDKPVSKDVGADVLLELPFTIRKLVNRINPLLPSLQQQGAADRSDSSRLGAAHRALFRKRSSPYSPPDQPAADLHGTPQ